MRFARLLPLGIYLVLGAALIYRLAPLLLGPDALARFFITEDGYLMLTVARNLGIGNGLSVSDGTIPTNGVQPLATFLYAIPYWFTGGDKVASLVGVLLIMTTWSVAAAFAVRAFAGEMLKDRDPVWAWLVAALWFAGPLMLLHSMNGLETGLHVLMVALTVTFFGRVCARGGRYTLRDQVLFGVLCGITFLARIDGALLVTALFAVRFVYVLWSRQLSLGGAVSEAILPGLISLAFAAPWLINNQIMFGSIMPVSGTSQAMKGTFGSNLVYLPLKLFETMFPMLPVPEGLERRPLVMTLALAALVPTFAWFLWRVSRTRHPFAVAIWGYTLFAAMIIAYYGLFFGAPYFLSRYMAPLSPLLITAAVWTLLDITGRLPARSGTAAARLAGLGALVLSAALLGRLLIPGQKEQGHFHVVAWVEENVDDDTWVGAAQTGTLGYWHDRTINLDGKVNPEALAAKLRDGNVLDYVLASKVDVIADWAGMAGWVEMGNPGFTEAFEVVVADREKNLAVLRRRGSDEG